GHIKQSLIDTLEIAVVNQNLGGDPRRQTHKVLMLAYSYGETGRQQKIARYEGGNLVLPEPNPGWIELVGVEIEVVGPERTDIGHKRKVRVTFKNNYTHSVGVMNGQWSPGATGVPAQLIGKSLQVKRNGEWTLSPDGHGESEVFVYAEEYFRTWVSVEGGFTK